MTTRLAVWALPAAWAPSPALRRELDLSGDRNVEYVYAVTGRTRDAVNILLDAHDVPTTARLVCFVADTPSGPVLAPGAPSHLVDLVAHGVIDVSRVGLWLLTATDPGGVVVEKTAAGLDLVACIERSREGVPVILAA